jgi:hypothetical protein
MTRGELLTFLRWGEARGRSGIRTHERVAPLTVFKTVAFVRSAILPQGSLPAETSLADHPPDGLKGSLLPNGYRTMFVGISGRGLRNRTT